MLSAPNPWFIRDWLKYWETHTHPAEWQKGKDYFEQKYVRKLEIHQGSLEAQVEAAYTYHVQIFANSKSSTVSSEIEREFIREPGLVLQVYQQRLTEVMVQGFPHRLGMEFTDFISKCSCSTESFACKHKIAVIHKAAEVYEEDMSQLLTFLGLDWEAILMQINGDVPRPSVSDTYRAVPLPTVTAHTKDKWSEKGTPPFWTSSFPYHLIIKEIYSKVKK
jgi:uncharacterized Zn finger protein